MHSFQMSSLKCRFISQLFTILFCLPFFASCESEKSVSTANDVPEKTVEQYQIALVMKTLTNPFFIKMEEGARQAEKELPVTLTVQTAATESSIQQQIGIIERLIKEDVDAIVIAPGDSVELLPALKKAQDAGIAVVNIDNRLSPEFAEQLNMSRIPFISVDNFKGAYDSARALIDALPEKENSILILEGIRGAANAEARKNGAMKAFEESDKTVVIASETANWKIDEGYSVAKTLFEKHPQVTGIFCANDMMAFGVIQYLSDANRKQVKVSSFDALDEALQAIASGELVATIDQQAALQGYMGIATAYKVLTGESVDDVVLVDTKTITKAQIKD